MKAWGNVGSFSQFSIYQGLITFLHFVPDSPRLSLRNVRCRLFRNPIDPEVAVP